jgi:branched-chain amino acid transport system substrate-binding protein
LKQANVAAVYAGAQAADAGIIVRQMRDQGLTAQFVAGEAIVDPQFWNIAGADGEGTLMTFPPDPQSLPEAKPLVEIFKAVGYNPEGYTLHTYAAVQTWAQAAAAAGSADGRKVAEALRSGMQFDTVLGRFTIDKKGDASLPAYVWCVWREGSYAYEDELNKRMGLVK